MIRRVSFEEWQGIITLIAFFLFFTLFIVISIRAWRMKKADRERIANLPLESEEQTPAKHE